MLNARTLYIKFYPTLCRWLHRLIAKDFYYSKEHFTFREVGTNKILMHFRVFSQIGGTFITPYPQQLIIVMRCFSLSF